MMIHPLVAGWPCDICEHLKMVNGEPPYRRCGLSPTGDCECERMQTVVRVAERAEQAAMLIAREPDRRLRADEAVHLADIYVDILLRLAALFDDESFLRRCDAPEKCRTCERRKPGDRWEIECESCMAQEAEA